MNQYSILGFVVPHQRQKFLGDSVKFSILRDKKPLEVPVIFDRAWPYTMLANSYDTQPAFVLPCECNWYSAGRILRRDRSPDAPKITNSDNPGVPLLTWWVPS